MPGCPEDEIMDETEDLIRAIDTFRSFLEGLVGGEPVTILCHSDADGVGAGVIAYKTLERLGFAPLGAVVTGKGEYAYSDSVREQLKEQAPKTLLVLDLGCRDEAVLPEVLTLFIDHHRPYGVPSKGTLISSYTWNPVPNTALLAYHLCQAVADVEDLDWVAAMGTLSDLGDKAPFPILVEAKKKYRAKWLREATTLVNSAKRSSTGDSWTAFQAVMQAGHPREIAEGTTEEARRLAEYRAEVNAALAEGKKAAPAFSGQVALVRVDSPCQIHPLVAQIWRTRLPKYIVLVANEGYLPGMVAFTARTQADVNVLDFLRGIELDDVDQFGYGHDKASGGILRREQWNQLLKQLGFKEKALAKNSN